MKRWVVISTGVILLFLSIFPANTLPARASSTLSPGFYVGWVSLVARTDFNGTFSTTDSQTAYSLIDKLESRGQLMVKIDNAGSGGASIVLPTAMKREEDLKMDTSEGACMYSVGTWARSNYVHLRGNPAVMGNTFQVPFNPAAGLYYTSSTHMALHTGEIGGCEQMSEGMEATDRDLLKQIAAEITAIQFQINYSSDTGMGGSCSLPGWVQTASIPPYAGSNIYSLPKCTWRVFKSNTTNPQKGWK
jgi:hypothetical protein